MTDYVMKGIELRKVAHERWLDVRELLDILTNHVEMGWSESLSAPSNPTSENDDK